MNLIMENFNYMYHKFNLSVTYLIRRLLEGKRNIPKETVLVTLFKSSVQIQKHEKMTWLVRNQLQFESF